MDGIVTNRIGANQGGRCLLQAFLFLQCQLGKRINGLDTPKKSEQGFFDYRNSSLFAGVCYLDQSYHETGWLNFVRSPEDMLPSPGRNRYVEYLEGSISVH
jgi:hypothetical protein